VNDDKRCAHCGEGTMKGWSDLSEEEREVVKRLPGAAEYKAEEREAMHAWCTRCWNEETEQSRQS
jgi:hypothetical protein